MKSRSFTVILHKEDDMYIAECPEVGTVDQGETIEEAIAGLREATRLYLEEFPARVQSSDTNNSKCLRHKNHGFFANKSS